jgi:hypothetical protein
MNPYQQSQVSRYVVEGIAIIGNIGHVNDGIRYTSFTINSFLGKCRKEMTWRDKYYQATFPSFLEFIEGLYRGITNQK